MAVNIHGSRRLFVLSLVERAPSIDEFIPSMGCKFDGYRFQQAPCVGGMRGGEERKAGCCDFEASISHHRM